MEDQNLLILTGAIVLLFILMTRAGRLLAVIGVAVIALVTANNTFIREYSCPRTAEACFIEIQKTWQGPCWTGERSGLLRIDGSYFLTAEAGVNASATCLNIAPF